VIAITRQPKVLSCWLTARILSFLETHHYQRWNVLAADLKVASSLFGSNSIRAAIAQLKSSTGRPQEDLHALANNNPEMLHAYTKP
jgi:hypothetical protein